MSAEHAYVPNMTRPMTAEDLLQPDVPEHAELVRGVLVVREPPGFRHGEITVRLASALMIHVDAHRIGRVVGGDAGFKLQADPDTVRGADIAFVSWERLPQRSPLGFPPLGPDLVVEVLSPGDRPGETLAGLALRWDSTRLGDRSRAATRADLSPGRFGVDSWRNRRIGG